MASEIIRQGRSARVRLKKNGGNWNDWKTVGHALLEGRVTAKAQRQHLAPRTGHNVGSKYGHGRYRLTTCVALRVVL
jgi:hypothetical protein